MATSMKNSSHFLSFSLFISNTPSKQFLHDYMIYVHTYTCVNSSICKYLPDFSYHSHPTAMNTPTKSNTKEQEFSWKGKPLGWILTDTGINSINASSTNRSYAYLLFLYKCKQNICRHYFDWSVNCTYV